MCPSLRRIEEVLLQTYSAQKSTVDSLIFVIGIFDAFLDRHAQEFFTVLPALMNSISFPPFFIPNF